MAAVVVLPWVRATTIEPCGSCTASGAAISGAMRAAPSPGRLVPPPRPDSTEARPASWPAVTASVALKREVMLLDSSSQFALARPIAYRRHSCAGGKYSTHVAWRQHANPRLHAGAIAEVVVTHAQEKL